MAAPVNTLLWLAVCVLLCAINISQCNPLRESPHSSRTLESEEDCPWYCTCNNVTFSVTCAGYWKHRYTYIPKLPEWARILYFKGNSLTKLTFQTFSRVNRTAMIEMHLIDNNTTRIAPDTFEGFVNLQRLNLSSNSVDASDLQKALYKISQLKNLKALGLRKMHLVKTPDNMWEGLNGSNIEELQLSHNSLDKFSSSALEGLPRIKILDFGGNLLSEFPDKPGIAPQLETLRLSYNDFHFVPDLCLFGEPIFPKLTLLSLNYNNIWYVEPRQINCLDRLQFLDLTGNLIQQFKPGFFTNMTALKRVEMAYLRTEGNVPRQFISLGEAPNIWRLTMINSAIRIGHDNVSVDLFKGLGNISEVYLGQNFFSQASDLFFKKLFEPLRNLSLLDLSSCELHQIPTAISQLSTLKTLWLFNNYLVQWPQHTFLGLPLLTHLSMADNQITILSSWFFPYNLTQQLTAVNLSGNPFTCTCDNLWLLEWMRRNTSVFKGNFSDYRCTSPSDFVGMEFANLTFTQTTCLIDRRTNMLVIVIFALVLCLSVIGPLVFRYRWHLQSAMFMIRYPTLRAEGRQVRRDYDFDAFLIYSEADIRRVRQEFLPRLEKDRNLHLCVHQRDFWAGKLIVDNIVDCMLASRCVVVMLSNAMATSEWCQFMLTLAHAEVVESGAAPLVLLLLEDIAPHNMTPTLYAVFKTTAFLRYPDSSEDKNAFWDQVHMAIREAM